MKTWLLFWWDHFRETLWFLPSVMVAAGFGLAFAALAVDHRFDVEQTEQLAWLGTTASSSRLVLSGLISALVTVLGLAFSLTMLAVSQTASLFGPRLIRSVFDQNVAQSVMGLFLGTIVYCMTVIRSIREADASNGEFTPHLAIFFAELAGTTCLFSLLYFANHVTGCMRAEILIKKIYDDAICAIRNLTAESDEAPEECGHSHDACERDKNKESLSLASESTGYLQAIELDRLVTLAETHDARVYVKVRQGEFVHRRATLAEIESDCLTEIQDELQDCRQSFLIGLTRTPRQDLESAVWELAEAGVRALSPGVNDPMTAINVIDYLSSALRYLSQRELPPPWELDKSGEKRVCVRRFTFESTLNTAFDQLRQNARGNIAVLCRLLEGLCDITNESKTTAQLEAIARQARMIHTAARRSCDEPEDLADIEERYEYLRGLVANP